VAHSRIVRRVVLVLHIDVYLMTLAVSYRTTVFPKIMTILRLHMYECMHVVFVYVYVYVYEKHGRNI
jgi:hypothetical protein